MAVLSRDMNAEQIADWIDDLRSRRENIDQVEADFLRARGWKYTCNTPGAHWLWQKELPCKRVALVTQSIAINMEHSIAASNVKKG